MHSLYVYQVVSTVSRSLSISTYVYVHLTINVGLEFLSSTGLLFITVLNYFGVQIVTDLASGSLLRSSLFPDPMTSSHHFLSTSPFSGIIAHSRWSGSFK